MFKRIMRINSSSPLLSKRSYYSKLSVLPKAFNSEKTGSLPPPPPPPPPCANRLEVKRVRTRRQLAATYGTSVSAVYSRVASRCEFDCWTSRSCPCPSCRCSWPTTATGSCPRSSSSPCGSWPGPPSCCTMRSSRDRNELKHIFCLLLKYTHDDIVLNRTV